MMSLSRGRLIFPSGRTVTVAEKSGSFHTLIERTSSGPMMKSFCSAEGLAAATAGAVCEAALIPARQITNNATIHRVIKKPLRGSRPIQSKSLRGHARPERFVRDSSASNVVLHADGGEATPPRDRIHL